MRRFIRLFADKLAHLTRQRAVARQRSQFLRPMLELLEERLAPSITRFAVIGDYGGYALDPSLADQPEQDVANLVKSWNPALILTVGDNNYWTGDASTIDANVGQYYHDFIYPYLGAYGSGATTNRFFPTLGDHDWGYTSGPNPTGDQPFLDYFTLPGNERYYTFTWGSGPGSIQFFALDSDPHEPDGVDSISPQAQWLRAQLQASTATYKIVYCFNPPYSSADSSQGVDFESPWMRWPFQAWGATAVLSGHAHNYERFIEDNNFPYFVNGLGGEGQWPFGPIEPGSQVHYNADFGAMLVTADETQMQFQFFTRTGTLIDTCTIPAPAPQTTLVNAGSDWKYLDNGTDQGTAWRTSTFDDRTWNSRPAQLGYGDGDEQTVVGYGPNPSNKYITTYFRQSFVVADPALDAGGLTVNLLRDDGAVIYLNGTEVLRSNMPAGTIASNTLAASTVTGADESFWYQASIDPALLVSGTNVLAVEIHQADPTSSDISFDLNLIGRPANATASSLRVAGFPAPATAGVAGNITVAILDAQGNTATGYRGTIRFSSTDSQAVLPTNYTFTAADNGVHTFSATLKTAGTQSLTATDTVTSSISGTQVITVQPAAASKLRVAGFPSPITAGVAGNFAVTILDAYGNTATSYRGTIRFSSTDSQAVLPANYTFTAAAAGVHTFSATLKTAGTQSLTATDTVTSSITGTQAITVQPAAASKLRVAGFPSAITAGTAGNFLVTVLDAYGNIATSYRGTIRFSSTDNRAVLPTNYTFTAADNGVHTFSATLKTAGTQSLTATDTVTSSITGTQSGIKVKSSSIKSLSGILIQSKKRGDPRIDILWEGP